MKTLVLLMVFGCVTASTNTGTSASPPFDVACTSKTSAKLTLTKSDQTKLIPGNGNCDPQKDKNGIYTLEQKCLNGGTFIVESTATFKDSKTVVTNGTEYNVSCTESNGPKIVVVSSKKLTVNGPNGSPVPETITFSSTQPLFMTLLTIKPDKGTITDKGPTNAQLGTSLYLTIVENQGNLKLVPRSCVASTASTGDTTIWSNEKDKACTYEGTIMTTVFQSKDIATQHVTYAEIVAFQFADDPTGEITFTCQVQECRTSDHDCPDDLASCKPSVKTRRRRELTHSNVDDAKIHHLTARLRIREDFAVHGGSGSVHYALSGLLLSVLIQIIL